MEGFQSYNYCCEYMAYVHVPKAGCGKDIGELKDLFLEYMELSSLIFLPPEMWAFFPESPTTHELTIIYLYNASVRTPHKFLKAGFDPSLPDQFLIYPF